MRVPVLAESESWVVVAKPTKLAVHRSDLVRDKLVLLQTVRNQLGRRVNPVHRLDRGASGCVVFSFEPEWTTILQAALAADDAVKTYLAFTRGQFATLDPIEIDTDVKDFDGVPREARSVVQCVARSDEPRRSSLAIVRPHTGRYHQVRRHVRDLNHPILGDSQHGDTRENRWWRDNQNHRRLGLHCLSLDLPLPDGTRLTATAPVPSSLRRLWMRLPWWESALAAVPELALTAPGMQQDPAEQDRSPR